MMFSLQEEKTENISTELNSIWGEIWRRFGCYESWQSDSAQCENIQQRLSHFNNGHLANPEHISGVIQALSRGFYLLKSSLEWYEPAVGCKSIDSINNTHKARGYQWRLVMAYAGFEIIVKTLLFKNEKSDFYQELPNFIRACQLNDYKLLSSPNIEKLPRLNVWLEKGEDGKAIFDFLRIKRGDASILKEWIINGQDISTWNHAVQLAKALRNTTAHGTLSASKVQQWKLQKPLLILSDNLGEIVLGGLHKLI